MQSSLKKILCLFALQTGALKVSAPTATILFKNYGHKKIQPYNDSFLFPGKQEATW